LIDTTLSSLSLLSHSSLSFALCLDFCLLAVHAHFTSYDIMTL
jgi:hypothetical protein